MRSVFAVLATVVAVTACDRPSPPSSEAREEAKEAAREAREAASEAKDAAREVRKDGEGSGTRLRLKGTWNESKGKLKQKFAELTDDDLLYVEGKEEEFYGKLQKRLGKSRQEVEKILEDL